MLKGKVVLDFISSRVPDIVRVMEEGYLRKKEE